MNEEENGELSLRKDKAAGYHPLNNKTALDSGRASLVNTDRPSHLEVDRPLLSARSQIWYESFKSNPVNPRAEHENDNPTGEQELSGHGPAPATASNHINRNKGNKMMQKFEIESFSALEEQDVVVELFDGDNDEFAHNSIPRKKDSEVGPDDDRAFMKRNRGSVRLQRKLTFKEQERIKSINDLAKEPDASTFSQDVFEDDSDLEDPFDVLPNISRSSKDTYVYLSKLQQMKDDVPRSIYDFPAGKRIQFGHIELQSFRKRVIASGKSRIFTLSIDKWNLKFADMVQRAKKNLDPFEKPMAGEAENECCPEIIFSKENVLAERETINYFELWGDGKMLIVRFDHYLKFFEWQEGNNKYEKEVGSVQLVSSDSTEG